MAMMMIMIGTWIAGDSDDNDDDKTFIEQLLLPLPVLNTLYRFLQ